MADTDKNILFVFGGGTIRNNGIYSDVLQALSKCKVVEFGGVEPNPRIETP